ncbi:pyridoxamine 5'-phosphate oxidase family protein [Lactococcus termiticola]|uniref:Pyridoxamine 5'-phosphate oxidase putative domain-containing protein n=1 Tax=Lactococcus termiticola TaxID=2169526 RepID=A0A2R5HJN3_9LACT|nr:pyridoxamine 5'-phosphate oxidase family protein [Lactococcus termiticola]GBG96521.1 hypothetical protein NtB2_00634 [Lactococcus termiticola]
MYLKRFVQLFVIFLVAALVFVAIFESNFSGNSVVNFIVASIVAYIVLTLPLVILTIAKARKKENIVGAAPKAGELAEILKKLPGYIALSVQNEEHKMSTTIMSFSQSAQDEGVLYMVAEPDAKKVANLKQNGQVSFTSWFEGLETGARLSSNQAVCEVFEDAEANKQLIELEPSLVSLHENAVNMAIIKMTIKSALYEDFKDGIKVLNF